MWAIESSVDDTEGLKLLAKRSTAQLVAMVALLFSAGND